jgi:hypothetical protein
MADSPHPRELPHARERLVHHEKVGPVKVADQHKSNTPYQAFNKRLAVTITSNVGTMTSAYCFCVLSLLSLPAVLSAFNLFNHVFPAWLVKTSLIALVAWIAQTFLQLVLLPIIIVGQNVQAEAADKRAQETYDDAVAILSAATEVHELMLCIHANPQTGPCPGHPEYNIPPMPLVVGSQK